MMATKNSVLTVDMPEYWQSCYQIGNTGWDVGEVSEPIKAYIDYLVATNAPKDMTILIAGAGNAYEAGYLYEQGFSKVYLVDFAPLPLENFSKKYPDFPKEQLVCHDFFRLDDIMAEIPRFDLAIEQTFLTAFEPKNRQKYAQQMYNLLKPSGQLVGVLLNKIFENPPPFGGDIEEYRALFSPLFDIKKLEPCYNSIPPRQGAELFMVLQPKG